MAVTGSVQHSVCRSLALAGTVSLGLSAFPGLAEPTKVAQISAADLGVMQLSLKDAIQFNWGFQGQTQGAGTPNAIGIGGFLPLLVAINSVVYFDILAKANLADIGNSSSIINTEVAGTTISTSSRLGYRWLNSNRSWMFGVNGGYDSRPMATGKADTGINVTNPQTVFFQQVAVGLEAISNIWSARAYALVPVGTREYRLNSSYDGGSLGTYGLDIGYGVTSELETSIGYYYQDGDLDAADGSGVRGRLAYNISNGLTLGVNLSYDQAFDTRFSADVKYRFGSNGYGAPKRTSPVLQVLQALSLTPENRDVRVHDTQTPPPEEVAPPPPPNLPPPAPPETNPPDTYPPL